MTTLKFRNPLADASRNFEQNENRAPQCEDPRRLAHICLSRSELVEWLSHHPQPIATEFMRRNRNGLVGQ